MLTLTSDVVGGQLVVFVNHRAQATDHSWVGWGGLLRTELGWTSEADSSSQGAKDSEDCLYPTVLPGA